MLKYFAITLALAILFQNASAEGVAKKSNRANMLSRAVGARMLAANGAPMNDQFVGTQQQQFVPIPRNFQDTQSQLTPEQVAQLTQFQRQVNVQPQQPMQQQQQMATKPSDLEQQLLDQQIMTQRLQDQLRTMQQMPKPIPAAISNQPQINAQRQQQQIVQQQQMTQQQQLAQLEQNLQQKINAQAQQNQQFKQQQNQISQQQQQQQQKISAQQQMQQPINMIPQQQIPVQFKNVSTQQQFVPMPTPTSAPVTQMKPPMTQQQTMMTPQIMQQQKPIMPSQPLQPTLQQQQQQQQQVRDDICMSAQPGDLIPHPFDETAFVICYGFGEFTIMECPEMLVYNPHMKRCDHNVELPPLCRTNPCQNGAKCVETSPVQFKCECAAGFGGQLCEKLDTCQTKPCGVEGACVAFSLGSPIAHACMCNGGRTMGTSCDRTEPNPCVQSSANHMLIGVGFHPSVFVHCEGIKPHFKFCQPPLIFSPQKQTCEWSL